MFEITRLAGARAVALLLGLALSACASTDFRVLEINALSSERPGEAQFEGLEAFAARQPLTPTRRVNILFLHGIGWVENPDEKPLANSFIKGLANAYGLTTDEKAVSSLCGRAADDENIEKLNKVYINATEPRTFFTALPTRTLKLDRLVCMDRQVLTVGDDLEYVIYRIFWDEAMWSALQFAHVGQDDNEGDSSDFAMLRRSVNRTLKDDLVNFGFSDAVMYMSPAGAEIRGAIRGAMCAAALDAAGAGFDRLGYETDYEKACALTERKTIRTDPFAFVTESLGSKIALDVIREAMTDGQETVHDQMIKKTSVFMLANQVPLLSLSDLSTEEPFRPSDYAPEERPTLIAFSEINDFLTYELVPFYEQLYRNTQKVGGAGDDDLNRSDRRRMVDLLGFNAIDMRVEFASPIIPFVNSFVDPEFAHNGHVQQAPVMEFILCGADNNEPRLDGCEIQMAANRSKP